MTWLIVCNGFSSLIVDGKILVVVLCLVLFCRKFSLYVSLRLLETLENLDEWGNSTFLYLLWLDALSTSRIKVSASTTKSLSPYFRIWGKKQDINTFCTNLIPLFFAFERKFSRSSFESFELSKTFMFRKKEEKFPPPKFHRLQKADRLKNCFESVRFLALPLTTHNFHRNFSEN